jgi:anti-anti-sigma regulatory factor
MTDELRVAVDRRGANGAILYTKGYINNVGGEEIANRAYELMDDNVRALLLNLRETKIVNSIGISILIEIIEKMIEKDGKIGFVSISMSNATQEFSRFKQLADADTQKAPHLVIVDCAQGGQAMAEWVDPDARPWKEADRRIASARFSAKQVQVAWIKLANKGPQGDLGEHGRKLQTDTLAVIQNAKARFPNLQIAYLSSRIYGGYATSRLNPEPYAYESAFAVRWLIQDQIKGEPGLNLDSEKGRVESPLLLWGPYLWADGTTPRASDHLVYTREDLADDGTHPSEKGREKVARLMLEFFKSDELTRPWFVGQ